MPDIVTPEDTGDGERARKPWVVPAVIVSDARSTEAHVTVFTDGTSNGPLAIPYGS
jgi:hypothetical protein